VRERRAREDRSPTSKGGAVAKEFTGELDGFVMRGETDDELVARVERHISEAHADLVGKLSRDDIRTKVAVEARTTGAVTGRPVPR
jgi:hypothetical protein